VLVPPTTRFGVIVNETSVGGGGGVRVRKTDCDNPRRS
jgi:hypothetical protein